MLIQVDGANFFSRILLGISIRTYGTKKTWTATLNWFPLSFNSSIIPKTATFPRLIRSRKPKTKRIHRGIIKLISTLRIIFFSAWGDMFPSPAGPHSEPDPSTTIF
ncbi:hypothetical protein H113_00464 [Trichophyton rubrum MR1459]|uniref:Uncharacterized protein n=1 Tax=Trichophyton rubrum (strain ATCC MYA-4607 / CBS 118892) TaxID=559305 RepID=A0A080WPW8_TRIRC|nr:uncharacterized protein TERG_12644 [Trichophyton rubrum CBS 118892]EZF99960.1 hypothetical protein H113_00464 [Trichophyton rubrum MR1459]EZG10756.1 hypothetical protein H106_00342 [Trichophyton rubrum CBS 735.88]KFL62947.1 hypothetical protein TERG_12644 [Trichophyton rubrum CBS 118892]